MNCFNETERKAQRGNAIYRLNLTCEVETLRALWSFDSLWSWKLLRSLDLFTKNGNFLESSCAKFSFDAVAPSNSISIWSLELLGPHFPREVRIQATSQQGFVSGYVFSLVVGSNRRDLHGNRACQGIWIKWEAIWTSLSKEIPSNGRIVRTQAWFSRYDSWNFPLHLQLFLLREGHIKADLHLYLL